MIDFWFAIHRAIRLRLGLRVRRSCRDRKGNSDAVTGNAGRTGPEVIRLVNAKRSENRTMNTQRNRKQTIKRKKIDCGRLKTPSKKQKKRRKLILFSICISLCSFALESIWIKSIGSVLHFGSADSIIFFNRLFCTRKTQNFCTRSSHFLSIIFSLSLSLSLSLFFTVNKHIVSLFDLK
jgi:hypothetical protein